MIWETYDEKKKYLSIKDEFYQKCVPLGEIRPTKPPDFMKRIHELEVQNEMKACSMEKMKRELEELKAIKEKYLHLQKKIKKIKQTGAKSLLPTAMLLHSKKKKRHPTYLNLCFQIWKAYYFDNID